MLCHKWLVYEAFIVSPAVWVQGVNTGCVVVRRVEGLAALPAQDEGHGSASFLARHGVVMGPL